MRELIFVDTESTGLDAKTDELVELSYATLDSEVTTLYFGVKEVPDFIDDLIKFTERGIWGKQSKPEEYVDFMKLATDNTMVAANPSHDKAFLKQFGLWTFHYRMLDIESYAFALLRSDEMPGMKNIYDVLSKYTDLPEPDHSSAGDVAAMRAAYIYLRDNV